MKLIDILVEELPKNGGWPDGIEKLEQYPDGSLFCGTKYKSDFKFPIVDDYGDDEVTRAEYEAALAVKNEGWIEWGSGECPVNPSEMVDVIFGHGGRMSTNIADCWRWNHGGTDSDIIAYRLHKPQEAAQPKADEEADLNECIGQDAAPVWNGEGLPPIGCVCEWQDKNTKQWQPVKVVYSSEWVTVIREINKERGDDLVEIAIENYGDDARLKFRPIRSAEDEKRDDRASAIDGFISGFRGQEAGSNKELAYALTDYLALLDKI